MFRRIITTSLVSTALVVTGASAQQQTLQVQRAEVVRPAEIQIEAPPRATILRAPSTEAFLQQRRVERRMDVRAVRAQPVIELEQGTADMRPVLDNPAAPINVAARLKARPALVNVQADSLEVSEIPEGIVVRQYLAYQLKPGTCTDAATRRTAEEQGAACFTRSAPTQRNAEFARPASEARFIANPAERRRAMADADRAAADQQAEIDADTAQLRQYLADPQRRAQIGAAEAARLSTLSDEQLQEEMLGRAQIEVEEVMFVPNLEAQDLRIQARPAFGVSEAPARSEYQLAKVSLQRDTLDARVLAAGGVEPASSPPAPSRPTDIRAVPTRPQGMTDFAAPPMLDISQDIAIDREYYLTGFTLGREHEWRRRVSITVYWCLLGCKRTYYVEPYAGFGYGFGLRLPLRMDGTWRYRHKNGQERAYFVPAFQPINGNTSQYTQAGIHPTQLFSGQELVAEAQAYAGLAYKLTGNWQGNISASVGADLTDRLPSPFTNGQFTPPAPGSTTPPVVRTIEQIDMLAGRASFGAVGAKIHPALKMELFSDGLKFDLRDHVAGKTIAMTKSGQPYELAVNDRHFSRFSVQNPVYNLGFQMTPGLMGRVYVDIAVWSHDWNWPVWFPQLKVKLPPSGVNFGCHAGTVCGHQYKLRADHWRPQPRATTSTRPARTNPPPARTNPAPRPERANPATQPQRANPQTQVAPARLKEEAEPERAPQ